MLTTANSSGACKGEGREGEREGGRLGGMKELKEGQREGERRMNPLLACLPPQWKVMWAGSKGRERGGRRREGVRSFLLFPTIGS